MSNYITLKFTISNDWISGIENVLKIAEKIKEKHLNIPINIEVKFK